MTSNPMYRHPALKTKPVPKVPDNTKKAKVVEPAHVRNAPAKVCATCGQPMKMA